VTPYLAGIACAAISLPLALALVSAAIYPFFSRNFRDRD
jgi:hypothetical protein